MRLYIQFESHAFVKIVTAGYREFFPKTLSWDLKIKILENLEVISVRLSTVICSVALDGFESEHIVFTPFRTVMRVKMKLFGSR